MTVKKKYEGQNRDSEPYWWAFWIFVVLFFVFVYNAPKNDNPYPGGQCPIASEGC